MTARRRRVPFVTMRRPDFGPSPSDSWSNAGRLQVTGISGAVAQTFTGRPSRAARGYLPPAQRIETHPNLADDVDTGTGLGSSSIRYPRLPSRRPVAPPPVAQPGSGPA